jgi:hypothetical protein
MVSPVQFFQEEFQKQDKLEREQVEVIGDTIPNCLRLACEHLGRKPEELDYKILKKGKRGFFFPVPFHIRVFVISEERRLKELSILDKKLTGGSGKLVSGELQTLIKPKDIDGEVFVKIYKAGTYLVVFPHEGNGKHVRMEDVNRKLQARGIVQDIDQDKIRKALADAKGDPVIISSQKPKQGAEGSCTIEVPEDNMTAFVTLNPPKPGGKDLEVGEVVRILKDQGISFGFNEKLIQEHLLKDKYGIAFAAAEGQPPVNGKNAEIRYYVRTEKKIELKEDASGKVDFRDLDLIENAVAGQLLAEKIPAQLGKQGRTIHNNVLPAKDGTDVELKQGKGTILSSDGRKLTAEINGQVLFNLGKISVETVYKVSGDVGIKTGNITFLGSIVITGNVEDNYSIKAAGNVEVYGVVQKATIEADGDIIIRAGVTGREEARIESTGGNIVAKFIQNANVITEKDIVVQEGLMHSNLSAGGKILVNGKRGQIVGGVLQAATLVAAKTIGSQANIPTDIIVGINPKFLKQVSELEAKNSENRTKKEQITKTYKTLVARKEADPAAFGAENEAQLTKFTQALKKLEKRIQEYDAEIENLKKFMEEQASAGKISVEKTVYSGVYLRIKNAEYRVKQDIQNKTFVEENDMIRSLPYENPEAEDKSDLKKKNKGKK